VRALVTGATGFIGSHLVDRLCADGWNVTCLTRGSPGGWLRHRDVRVVRTAFDDGARLAREVSGCDRVFHLAGAIKALTWDDYWRGNVETTRHLIDACLSAERRPGRLVIVSSQAAGGTGTRARPRREDDADAPTSAYGRSKLLAEQIALDATDLDVVVVRPSTVFGPRDPALLPFFRLASRGIVPRPLADPIVSVIYVADLVECLVTAARVPSARGRVYHAANRDPASFRDLGQAIASACGVRAVEVPVPDALLIGAGLISGAIGRITGRARPFDLAKAREILHSAWVADTSRAFTELGFTPRTPYGEGLAITANWYQSQGWF